MIEFKMPFIQKLTDLELIKLNRKALAKARQGFNVPLILEKVGKHILSNTLKNNAFKSLVAVQ